MLSEAHSTSRDSWPLKDGLSYLIDEVGRCAFASGETVE